MSVLIPGEIKCSLCGELLESRNEDAIRTGQSFSQVWRRGMHLSCFVRWPGRGAFVEDRLNSSRRASGRQPRGAVIHDDDVCRLVLLPAGLGHLPEHVKVLQDPPLDLYLKHTMTHVGYRVSSWLNGLASPSELNTDIEQEALGNAIEILGKRFPDATSLFIGVDVDAIIAHQKADLEQSREASQAELKSRQDEHRPYNEAMQKLAEAEAHCPRCGGPASTMRYYDLQPKGQKSCFICQLCERSAHLADFASTTGPHLLDVPEILAEIRSTGGF